MLAESLENVPLVHLSSIWIILHGLSLCLLHSSRRLKEFLNVTCFDVPIYIIISTELVFSYLHFHLFYRYLPHRFFICNSVLKVIFYFIFFPSSIFTSYFLFTLDVFAKGWSKTSHITNIWFCWSYLTLFCCSSSDSNLSSLLVYLLTLRSIPSLLFYGSR